MKYQYVSLLNMTVSAVLFSRTKMYSNGSFFSSPSFTGEGLRFHWHQHYCFPSKQPNGHQWKCGHSGGIPSAPQGLNVLYFTLNSAYENVPGNLNLKDYV